MQSLELRSPEGQLIGRAVVTNDGAVTVLWKDQTPATISIRTEHHNWTIKIDPDA